MLKSRGFCVDKILTLVFFGYKNEPLSEIKVSCFQFFPGFVVDLSICLDANKPARSLVAGLGVVILAATELLDMVRKDHGLMMLLLEEERKKYLI